jgi:hypothetical protein
MHVLINVKSSNNISKWQVGFNSAFKGLNAEFQVTFAKFCMCLKYVVPTFVYFGELREVWRRKQVIFVYSYLIGFLVSVTIYSG